MKASTGTITVNKATTDGFNINQYFLMKGGTLNISGVGDDGLTVSDESGNGLIYFEVPSSISGTAIMLSSSSLKSGTTYYLRPSASYTGTTWNGLGISG